MKKFIFLVIVVLLAWGAWYYTHRTPVPVVTSKPAVITESGHIDLSNATFTFDDGPVTLKNRTASTPIPDSEETQDTFLSDAVGYGDINNDGKEDGAAILVQSSGGSGVFVYLAAYVSGPLGYKSTNTVFIGDRVTPQTVSIKNGTVTLTYLDRKPDEALAADATVLTTKQFSYSTLDNSLNEK